jgi:hypothetical protein
MLKAGSEQMVLSSSERFFTFAPLGFGCDVFSFFGTAS